MIKHCKFLYENKVSKEQIDEGECDLDGISPVSLMTYLIEFLNQTDTSKMSYTDKPG